MKKSTLVEVETASQLPVSKNDGSMHSVTVLIGDNGGKCTLLLMCCQPAKVYANTPLEGSSHCDCCVAQEHKVYAIVPLHAGGPNSLC